MAQQPIHSRYWMAAQQLAAELAQWGFDDNLLKTAAAYVKAYPEASVEEWLERLARLGGLFSSSLQTGHYRHRLQVACQRVQPRPTNGHEWAWVLSWAARLYKYYNDNPEVARQVSDVSSFNMPPAPKIYRPTPARPPTPQPSPEPEQVSEKGADLFAQMEAFWEKKDKEK